MGEEDLDILFRLTFETSRIPVGVLDCFMLSNTGGDVIGAAKKQTRIVNRLPL